MVFARSPHTRGFLFADLRGYSAFTERHGDRAAHDLLARYRKIVREVIASSGGAEIRTEGDSFYIVFDSVGHAVMAGIAILDAADEQDPDPSVHPITVGIGVHAGESEDSDEGIVSGAVNTAARICASADAGELLVSDTVRALTRTYLDVTFIPRGRRRLKGIAEPVAVFSVARHPDGLRPRGFWATKRRTAMRTATLVVLVVIGLASLAGTLSRRDAPGMAPTASPTVTQALASNAAVASDLDPFPNAAEEVLLRRVAVDDRGRCERALSRDAPHIWFRDGRTGGPSEPWATEPVPFQGSITCRLTRPEEPDTVWYWSVQPATQRGMSIVPVELVRNHGGRFGVFPGGEGCAVTHRALEDWSFGPVEGLLMCHATGDGDAILEWGYDDANILAKAVRHDGDMVSLLNWWSDTARFAP